MNGALGWSGTGQDPRLHVVERDARPAVTTPPSGVGAIFRDIHWLRVTLAVILGLLALLYAAEFYVAVFWHDALGSKLGMDYDIYMAAAQRWLDGGSFYLPEQLAGPYEIEGGVILYPPIALLLFVPFTFLPGFLWWALPLGITGWVIWSFRPALWGWVAMMALLTCWFFAMWVVFFGTPTIWIVALTALGPRFGWPGALVFMKPTLGLFALFGIRDRRWWLACAGLAVVSLAMLPMWFDWLTIAMNARGEGAGIWYSFNDVPFMFVPVAAWLARTTHR